MRRNEYDEGMAHRMYVTDDGGGGGGGEGEAASTAGWLAGPGGPPLRLCSSRRPVSSPSIAFMAPEPDCARPGRPAAVNGGDLWRRGCV